MDRREEGRRIIEEMMGHDHIVKRDGKRNSWNGALQDYSDEVCFGTIWSRPGIERKQRSILNIVMFIAMNRPRQLRAHIESALNQGCTVDELRETILHTAVYAGLPAAHEGFKVAEEVLQERGLI